MEFSASVAIIVAAIAPFITALFTNPNMSDTRKRVIAGLVSLLLGMLVAVGSGLVEGVPQEAVDWVVRVAAIIGIVVGLSQGFYKQFKPAVETVEQATTMGGRSDDPPG